MTDCPNARDEQVCADCTFEQGTCRWLDTSIGPFSWARDQAMIAGPIHSGPVDDRKFILTRIHSKSFFILRYNAYKSRILYVR